MWDPDLRRQVPNTTSCVNTVDSRAHTPGGGVRLRPHTCRKLCTLAVPSGTRNEVVALAVMCEANFNRKKLDPSNSCCTASPSVPRPGKACRVVFARLRTTFRREVSPCRPRVFVMMRVLARPVFRDCLRTPTCLCATRAFARDTRVASFREGCKSVWSGSVFRRPLVFAPRSVFAGHVSSNAHVSSCSSPSMCVLTMSSQTFFATSVLDPMCLQDLFSVFGRYAQPSGDRNGISAYIYNAYIYVQMRTYIYTHILTHIPGRLTCTEKIPPNERDAAF